MNYKCKICGQIIDNDSMCPYCGSDNKYIEPLIEDINESNLDEELENDFLEEENKQSDLSSENVSDFNNELKEENCELHNETKEEESNILEDKLIEKDEKTKEDNYFTNEAKNNEEVEINSSKIDKNLANLKYLAEIFVNIYNNNIKSLVDFQYILSNYIVTNFDSDLSIEELISLIDDEKLKKVLKQFTNK